MNRIFYIIGKSASGKDTMYSRIVAELGLLPIVLYTTRPVRSSEQEGVEYHFVDDQRFREMQESGKVIESRTYHTCHGDWTYYTAADSISLDKGDCAGIGTVESFLRLREYCGRDTVVPIYVEVNDDIRFLRAVEREKKQSQPKYAELCRRFLADNEDFSDEKLAEAGIGIRFGNNGTADECFDRIKKYISGLREDTD
ncbi:MAG: guanylate kinase [Ruminococcus sp.]|uniref:guanylate kinase n=1 Tax=Ruminococcus sp. TaxID=41978 RepID=UPI0025D37856|nr:guanylate kinase [Ruminococcus sp.]MBR5683604.1 guanylate kinase [Ruminococcus sp.]